MALEQSDKDFLKWVDAHMAGWNDVPSNWDKMRAPYLINELGDTTWGNIYKRALQNYMNEGGTKEEAAILAPKQHKKAKEKANTDKAAAEEQAALTDPLGSELNKHGVSVTTDADNGRTYASGITDPKTGAAAEHFLYTSNVTNRAYNGSEMQQTGGDTMVSYNYDSVRKQVLEDAIKTKTESALFDALYKNGLISKQVHDSKDVSSQEFNKGLQYALRNYSVDTIDSYNLRGVKQAMSFMDYLSKGSLGGSLKPTSRTTYDSVITKRADAADDADQFYMTWLGRGANKAEEDSYYAALRDAEKKHVVATTTKYDADGNRLSSAATGEGLTQDDKLLILGKVAGKTLSGTDIGKVLSSGAGAAREVNAIKAYANAYGIRVSDQDAVKYVADNLYKGQDSKTTKAKLLTIAKGQYQNLSNLISDDVSISDLTTNYRYNYGQTLEVSPDSVDVFDPHIQNALMNNGKTGMMSLTDFDKSLRQDARWSKTKNAREEASKYAYDILSSFGLMA